MVTRACDHPVSIILVAVVEARVLHKAARARSKTAKEHAETARRAASTTQAGALQATDPARKAEKRRRERIFMRKETRRKMDARNIARGFDFDDSIIKAKETAAAALAIAKITRVEASEARTSASNHGVPSP